MTATVVVAIVYFWGATKIPLERTHSGQPAGDDGRVSASAEAGWYADPWSCYEYRYWDGATWTSLVASGGKVSIDKTHP